MKKKIIVMLLSSFLIASSVIAANKSVTGQTTPIGGSGSTTCIGTLASSYIGGSATTSCGQDGALAVDLTVYYARWNGAKHVYLDKSVFKSSDDDYVSANISISPIHPKDEFRSTSSHHQYFSTHYGSWSGFLSLDEL